jgi:hypothetical protein
MFWKVFKPGKKIFHIRLSPSLGMKHKRFIQTIAKLFTEKSTEVKFKF